MHFEDKPSESDVLAAVGRYQSRITHNPRHRYRSWDHCYAHFHRLSLCPTEQEISNSALQLAFYLASWGMYRGSSFLLQLDFTVHIEAVRRLVGPAFVALRTNADWLIGNRSATSLVIQAADSVRDSYSEFGRASDTLVTKILLGTLACLPACDRYFIAGYKASGKPFSRLTARFVDDMIDLCADSQFIAARNTLPRINGAPYPLMKVIDMHYWELGYSVDKSVAV